MGNNVFRLSVRGFSDADVAAIKKICSLTDTRQRSYKVCHPEDLSFDILIIDGASTSLAEIADSKVPAVWIGGEPSDHIHYRIERPILSSRLLKILDQVTVNSLHYIPEINIGVQSVHDRKGLAEGGHTQWQFEPDHQHHTKHPDNANQYRVLVADDSQVVRTQLQLILDNLGIRSDYATDGLEALKAMQQHRYDLILMDVVMPNMDGLEATKKIKNEFDGHGPVILLTSKTSQFDKLRGAFAGCDTYLTKPLNQQDLVAVLKKHLEIAQLDSDFVTDPTPSSAAT